MFNVVLHEPEIPPNTGNLMRLTVNTGCQLHLIHPLGFDLDEARLRRAGLDYREHAAVAHHDSYAGFLDAVDPPRVVAFSQHGETLYTEVGYRPGDSLLFGKESVGLPAEILEAADIVARIPIAAGGRSLNLANAAAIAVYEAWRQHGFGEPTAGP